MDSKSTMSGTIEAYVTFLSPSEGGRSQPAVDSKQYRPHIVIGDPRMRSPVPDSALWGAEDYLGVSFGGSGRTLQPGKLHHVRMIRLYEPKVNYDAVVPGATFTIREGGRIVGCGVVATRR